MLPRNRSVVGRKLAILGAWLQLSLPVSLLSWAGLIAHSSTNLDRGPESPELSELSRALLEVGCIGGFFLALAGYVLLLIALMAKGYHARWFFWFLMAYGGVLIATPFGWVPIVYCLVRRTDFFPRRTVAEG